MNIWYLSGFKSTLCVFCSTKYILSEYLTYMFTKQVILGMFQIFLVTTYNDIKWLLNTWVAVWTLREKSDDRMSDLHSQTVSR